MKAIRGRLQQFAGAMMTPIILLVLVGFFVGIGSAFTNYILPEGTFIFSLFAQITSIGFMFMNYLPVWFAVALAFALAKKEKGWAAFSGLVLFFAYHTAIRAYAGTQGFTAETVSVEALMGTQGMGQLEAENFNSLWSNLAGIFTFNMGIFSGIITGLVTAAVHNKYYDKELPNLLSFFSGTRFVTIVVSLLAIPLAMTTYYVWPFVASMLQGVTSFITNSGLLGTFVFGTLDKMLLPFGIHHLIAFPIEYTSVGGVMEIDGTLFEGVRNIVNGQAASAEATSYITRNFTTGRILFQLGGLPGIAAAIYAVAKPENRKKVASIVVPAAVTCMLVGISEPIEYTFLFIAPLFYYLVYAPLSGLAYVVTEVMGVSINGHALFFMIPNLFQPHKVQAWSLLLLIPLWFFLYYFIFKAIILKFNIKTPGREAEDDIRFVTKQEYRTAKGIIPAGGAEVAGQQGDLIAQIIDAFGGRENIEELTSCATRLRVTVSNPQLVVDRTYWQDNLEALGVVENNQYYQIVYGPRVLNLTAKLRDRLGLNEE